MKIEEFNLEIIHWRREKKNDSTNKGSFDPLLSIRTFSTECILTQWEPYSTEKKEEAFGPEQICSARRKAILLGQWCVMPAHVLLSTRTSFLAFPKYNLLSRSVVTHSVAWCNLNVIAEESQKYQCAKYQAQVRKYFVCVKQQFLLLSGCCSKHLKRKQIVPMFIHLFHCEHHRFLMEDAVPAYSHICCLVFRRLLLFIFRSANLHWIVKALVSFGTVFEEGRRRRRLTIKGDFCHTISNENRFVETQCKPSQAKAKEKNKCE